MSYVVAAYDVDRAYGGPEEGGWWYNTGCLVRTLKVFRGPKAEDNAYEYAGKLNRRLRSRAWGPNSGKREISSVLSEGEIQAEVWEDSPPQRYPERKPHYE